VHPDELDAPVVASLEGQSRVRRGVLPVPTQGADIAKLKLVLAADGSGGDGRCPVTLTDRLD
jgi:hypothetical protein